MRIAVSGTHYIGKSTLIDDFMINHPGYQHEIEPYYKLDDKKGELSLEPSLDNLIEQLDCSIEQLNQYPNEGDVIFDRCPIDFIAYAMCAIDQDGTDINENEISERFQKIKKALNNLDLIVFLPITKEDVIEYTEDNPGYRIMADKFFKKIYRDDFLDIFPKYNHPRVVEICGNRLTRIKILESYL